jgi:hypothetical protein
MRNSATLLGLLLALTPVISCGTTTPTPGTTTGSGGDAQFLDGVWTSLFEDGRTDCLTFLNSLLVDVRTGCTGANTLLSSQPVSRVGDLLTFIISGTAQDGSTTQTTASLRVISNDLLSGSILRVRADGTQAILAVTLARN